MKLKLVNWQGQLVADESCEFSEVLLDHLKDDTDPIYIDDFDRIKLLAQAHGHGTTLRKATWKEIRDQEDPN